LLEPTGLVGEGVTVLQGVLETGDALLIEQGDMADIHVQRFGYRGLLLGGGRYRLRS